MSDHPRPTRRSRLLAYCCPSELREQYADDLARFIDDARLDPRYRDVSVAHERGQHPPSYPISVPSR